MIYIVGLVGRRDLYQNYFWLTYREVVSVAVTDTGI